MIAKTNQQVEDFPHDQLPQLTADQIWIENSLRQLFSFSKTPLSEVEWLEPLESFLSFPCELMAKTVEVFSHDDFQKNLSDEFLMSVFKVEPFEKRCCLLFDKAFVTLLTQCAISKKNVTPSKISYEALKPLTPMSEGVVMYAVVSLLEAFSKKFLTKEFKPVFDRIARQPKDFVGLFSNKEVFGVVSIEIQVFEKSFFLKFALPKSLLEQIQSVFLGQNIRLKKRLSDFERFKMPFVTEIAKLELSQKEFSDLEVGDIVLLDSDLSWEHGLKSGRCSVYPVSSPSELGYDGELEILAEGEFQVKLKGAKGMEA